MRKFALGLVALSLAAAPALAQTPMTFADVDTDASGELSFLELQAVWPDLTEDEFNAVDLDLSGGLNADELNALQPSTMPAPMGDAMSVPTPLDEAAPAPAPDTGESLLDSSD
ncbi:hypothetical protein NIM87_04665 [Devosia sp. XJ19-1]|uniref:EF-hand domain-containing protein n=1 Tax=Devosia ureilytica TaxID=2952754 RepID=A0A9Q4FR04_9HYPH|nr:hypothetical protein [Devosia ureilytica]MCP8882781.1 hypothetical protein [Devosia ureilytica]MCP8886851.1 hypothetical protein [Devosia ureilytica]